MYSGTMTYQDYIAEHAAQCDADEREFHEAGLRALGVDHAAEVKRLTAERDSLQALLDYSYERRAALTARVAELESGSAFVGEEIKPGDFCADGELIYYLPKVDAPQDTLLAKECEGSAVVSDDGRIRYRCTFPTTAPLPTAGDEDDQGWLTPGRKILYAPSSDRYFVGRVRAKPHTLSDGTPVVHLHEMEPAYAEYTGKSGDKAHNVYAAAVCNCQPYREARPAPAEPDSPAEERDTKRGFDYCMSCGGDLDTGWECNSCGLDWMPWVQFRPDAVDRPTKLRDESWLREAADAEDQHASVCAGDMAPRKPACLDGVPAVLCEDTEDGSKGWAYGPIDCTGDVAVLWHEIDNGISTPSVSVLKPLHHDPSDAAAVELRGRIERGGGR